MPRTKKKSRTEAPTGEPVTVAAALEQLPVAATIANHEADEAVSAFTRQREREQAAAEPRAISELVESGKLKPASDLESPNAAPLPEPEKNARQPMSWGETVRPWKSHGDAGVEHVTTTSPDMVGIRFTIDKRRTDEEKREMEAAGLRFMGDAKAWLKTNRDGAFDETKDLAERFAQRRKERAEAELAR